MILFHQAGSPWTIFWEGWSYWCPVKWPNPERKHVARTTTTTTTTTTNHSNGEPIYLFFIFLRCLTLFFGSLKVLFWDNLSTSFRVLFLLDVFLRCQGGRTMMRYRITGRKKTKKHHHGSNSWIYSNIQMMQRLNAGFHCGRFLMTYTIATKPRFEKDFSEPPNPNAKQIWTIGTLTFAKAGDISTNTMTNNIWNILT